LFAWVKQELLESIARGEFSRDEPFITQREIVERFQVSTTTAIRALNELVADGVVVRHRGKGTFVAERPPAAPVGPTRPPEGQRVITYVSPGFGGAHGAELLAGLAAECAERGSRLVVEHTGSAVDEEPVLSRLADGGTHGVVLFTHDRSTAAGALARLQERSVAVVLVDRYLPGHPTDAVLFDDLTVGYEVTAAMLDRGHPAPVMLWSEADVTSVRDRLAGHRRALRDRGSAELPERFVLRPYDQQDEQARRRELRELLAATPRATALIWGTPPRWPWPSPTCWPWRPASPAPWSWPRWTSSCPTRCRRWLSSRPGCRRGRWASGRRGWCTSGSTGPTARSSTSCCRRRCWWPIAGRTHSV
jgi:hypothetical protein